MYRCSLELCNPNEKLFPVTIKPKKEKIQYPITIKEYNPYGHDIQC